MTNLTYALSATSNGEVNPDRMIGELEASFGKTPLTVSSGDAISITFHELDLDAAQIQAVDQIVAGHDGSPRSRSSANYCVKTYLKRLLVREAWYGVDNGDGTYSELFEDTVYTYGSRGSTLISRTNTGYYLDGSIVFEDGLTYHTGTNGSEIVKKVIS